MTIRRLSLGLCLLIAWTTVSTLGFASERRMTPVVRAIQRVKNSAVNIHSEKTTYGDSLFSSGKGRKVNGMGTGVVVDERGYIVTNHHVVKGVDSLRCVLYDGSTYMAQVVSFDSNKDLAIIKINASRPLPVMPLGTSSDLMLGETVLAVGNAYGYEHSVTAGIVSSLSRDVEVNEKQSYQNLIQTDASINPSNSGGPLINLDGEVIGINVAIRAGAQRIGFAIPIDDARKTIAQLMSIEQLNSTWHGAITEDIKSPKIKELKVSSILPNSPAKIAGLNRGDVILKAGDVNVTDTVDWERGLLGHRAGERVPVRVKRDEKELDLEIVLSSSNGRVATPIAQSVVTPVAAQPESSIARTWTLLGMNLAQLNKSNSTLQNSRYRGGMRITGIRPGSPAEKNGLKEGDVLVGLHIWETVNEENVSYVLDHPDFGKFAPLKFYILRGKDTLYGHLRVLAQRD
ncbi:MAG: trypsin-like peptidase domain-containing protein [Planctomycetaceae bacterium]|nr:trypsin-like peptidase domain-containing protein [Planctomycetaceae bacterium]